MKRNAPFVVLLAAAIALPSVAAGAAPDKPSVYWVGIAKRSIDPSANGTFDGQPVYLGGYGFGSGAVGVGPASQQNVYTDGRTATGLLKDAHPETGDPGIFARAMVVAAADDPKQALVLGEARNELVRCRSRRELVRRRQRLAVPLQLIDVV